MGATFTITQSPTSANLYLYPNGDSMVALTPQGEANNYGCVDETYDLPDDDTSYVYSSATSTVTDIYSLPNHTTESGTINYVKVISRAKSHTYQQSSSGIYNHLISISATTYPSSDINLTTDYTSYNTIWASSPTDGVTAWTWADIDNLKIGIACSSPTATFSAINLVLRPNADGSIIHLSSTSALHYATVDEEIVDTSDHIKQNTTVTKEDFDTFYFPDHTTEYGTINSLSIYYYGRAGGSTPDYCVRPLIIISGVSFFGTQECSYTRSWALHSYTWTSNPSTSVAWTWADIDALEAGIGLQTAATYVIYCAQFYVVVNYTEEANPEIRTTQCYAVVNYVPSSSTCYLNQPTSYSYNHSRETKKINFWNDSRAVYDIQRNSKTVTLEGIEYSSTATSTLNCINGMKDSGVSITITGMTDTNLNTTWYIRDFSYTNTGDAPLLYNWTMNLEKA